MPIGTLNQNTLRQPMPVSSPPRIGPSISPAPITIALIPSALPSSLRGKASVTSAAEVAMISAPPTPWTTRPRIRSPAAGAIAQNSDATVKIARPAANVRTRPTMSARRPALSTSTVATSV